jgi:hypothetical protein
VIVQIATENSERELDWQDVCDDGKLAPYFEGVTLGWFLDPYLPRWVMQ